MPTVRTPKSSPLQVPPPSASRYYDLLSGSHSRHEPGIGVVTYHAGERILMSDTEAATHASRIQISRNQTHVEPTDAVATAAPTAVENPWLEVLEGPAPTVISTVATLDDVVVLQSLLDAETANRARSGVTKTLQRRIANLTGAVTVPEIHNNGPLEAS
jgi:hypothetical protein